MKIMGRGTMRSAFILLVLGVAAGGCELIASVDREDTTGTGGSSQGSGGSPIDGADASDEGATSGSGGDMTGAGGMSGTGGDVDGATGSGGDDTTSDASANDAGAGEEPDDDQGGGD